MNFKMLDQSYLLYGIQFLTDICVPNDLPIRITDVYFPKMAVCQFLQYGPGGDINVSKHLKMYLMVINVIFSESPSFVSP